MNNIPEWPKAFLVYSYLYKILDKLEPGEEADNIKKILESKDQAECKKLYFEYLDKEDHTKWLTV